MALTLLPTVELEPSGWAEPGYEELIGTPHWDELWERSLSRWQVKPVASGGRHVSTESFQSEDTLTRLLTLELQGVKGFPAPDGTVMRDDERVTPIYGGYWLFDADGRAAAIPSCCCHLGDLGAWRRAGALGEGEDSRLLEIGHGQWSARRDGGRVFLTQEPELAGFEPITTLVSADELLAATDVAERVVEAFRRRLLPILRRLVEDRLRAERLSLLLVGLR